MMNLVEDNVIDTFNGDINKHRLDGGETSTRNTTEIDKVDSPRPDIDTKTRSERGSINSNHPEVDHNNDSFHPAVSNVESVNSVSDSDSIHPEMDRNDSIHLEIGVNEDDNIDSSYREINGGINIDCSQDGIDNIDSSLPEVDYITTSSLEIVTCKSDELSVENLLEGTYKNDTCVTNLDTKEDADSSTSKTINDILDNDNEVNLEILNDDSSFSEATDDRDCGVEPSNLTKIRDNSRDSGIGSSNIALGPADELSDLNDLDICESNSSSPKGKKEKLSYSIECFSSVTYNEEITSSKSKSKGSSLHCSVECVKATTLNDEACSSTSTTKNENISDPLNATILDDEAESSFSGANHDNSHDSGIASSSTDEPSTFDGLKIKNPSDKPIPLQVVALAEGFGLGDFSTDYSENDFSDDEDDDDNNDREVSHHVVNVDNFYDDDDYGDDDDDDDESNFSYNTRNDLMTCLVCFEAFSGKKILHCYECDIYVCLKCMSNHIEAKIRDGVIRLYCAGDSCSRLLSDQMISAFCPDSMPIFIKNRVEVENNPLKKTCPNCHKVEVISDLNDLRQRQIKCSACLLLWCHSCYTPWHSGISCQFYQKDVVGVGKKALKFWAKSKGKQTANARKCPNCHFYIERISGCDHMTCNRCNTDFCYKCGERHRSMGWFGNHYSTYSFLGCKYNLLPKKPVLRIMIRSSAFFGAVLGAPVVAMLVVTGALCIIAISPILIPIWCYKKCKPCRR